MKFGKKDAHSGAKRSLVLVVSVLVLLLAVAGGTLAWLTAQTDGVVNTFTPAQVSCAVTEEEFKGETKKNVNVENTSYIPAYIRVKLVTYRVNAQNQHIGGTAEIPEFTPGKGWVKYGEYYYYTLPVAPKGPGALDNWPKTPLIGETGIELVNSYNDADGGKQVVEVMAEAIQSSPPEAVGKSWGVTISEGSVTAYSAGN